MKNPLGLLPVFIVLAGLFSCDESSNRYADTTLTDARGVYLFEDVPEGRFSLSAAMTESPVCHW